MNNETNKAIKEMQSLLTHYRKIHDGLSDMIESGRLVRTDIPYDYTWLVQMLSEVSGIDPIASPDPREEGNLRINYALSFYEADKEYPDAKIVDLLADLYHYCEAHDIILENCQSIAVDHYAEEKCWKRQS